MDFTPINNKAISLLSEAMPFRIRAKARSVIFELLMNARRKPGNVEGYDLKRGDVKFSARQLPEITGCSRQSCRTILKHLFECHFLTRKVTHPDMIVSVSDFDSYINDNLESNPLSNPQVTHLQPTSHIKEVVKDKSKKKERRETPHTEWIERTIEYWYGLDHTMDLPEDTTKVFNAIALLLTRTDTETLQKAIDHVTTDAWWIENKTFRGLDKLAKKNKEGEIYWKLFAAKANQNGHEPEKSDIFTADILAKVKKNEF